MNTSQIAALSESFIAEVLSSFPSDFMSRQPEELEIFGKDWTRVYAPHPSAVVFPRSTDEVSRFLRLCSRDRIYVVPSGGRTGLAGGAVAARGEIVLSLKRMNHMGPVNSLSQTVQVQAGAITQAVHQHCLPWGLAWPIEFASQGSSQVGGNISTNAGGVKVIRYGLTRNWVLGLQVVTMAGDILNLNGGLEKNNTGIDLRQLFIGSEGVLGVITEATLKLARVPETLEVFFFAVRDIKAIFNLFREARKSPFQISAFECLTENCLKVVSEIRGIASPFHTTYPAYVLVEMERHASTSQESRDEWLTHLFDAGLVLDGTLAQSLREAQSLWSLREGISESLAVKGFVHKNDIALPVFNLEQFIDEMDEVFARRHPSLEIFLFGHIGDGNLHVNTMKPKDWEQEQFVQSCQQVDLDLFELVKKYSGSVSAEHGIGLLKKSALHFSRSPEEVALMRAMKAVLDPHGLLNPGKIFDALSS